MVKLRPDLRPGGLPGQIVAGTIEPALQAAETACSTRRPTRDLTAYDLYLRASAMVLSSARQTPEALRLLEQAIARDPHYGPALAWAAFCCFRLLLHDRSDDREADRRKGADFARRALEVAGDDPGVLANAAEALAYFGEDIGAMMALVDRALALNPNFARGWHVSGVLRTWAGQPEIGIGHAKVSRRLSPGARLFPSLLITGAAHFIAGRFYEAVPKLLLAIQENSGFPEAYRYLAACYAHMGRLESERGLPRLFGSSDLRVQRLVRFSGGKPLRDRKFADSLRWRETDSNFRFRVRCKPGLRRRSPASAVCRRRLSGAAGPTRDKGSVPRFRFAP